MDAHIRNYVESAYCNHILSKHPNQHKVYFHHQKVRMLFEIRKLEIHEKYEPECVTND